MQVGIIHGNKNLLTSVFQVRFFFSSNHQFHLTDVTTYHATCYCSNYSIHEYPISQCCRRKLIFDFLLSVKMLTYAPFQNLFADVMKNINF